MIREVYISIPAEKPTLGLSLQWSPLAIAEDVWHILDVAPNSPADTAGLLPYGDYVIGSPEGLVRGESGLGELVDDVGVNFLWILTIANTTTVPQSPTATSRVQSRIQCHTASHHHSITRLGR